MINLLNLIKNDGDVENWALMKKLELEGKLTGSELKKESDKANMSSSPSKQDLLDPQIPMDYDFTMSHPNQHKFPPTMPMLSVDHSNHRVPKDKRLIKTPGTNNNKESPNTDVSDENNSSEDEGIIDDSAAKRKLQSMRTDKRVKY
ncbi:MAG: hypothetical protein HLX45_05515 [Bacillus sp. (in: Bacteria)]|nr:hypothetical protein [Bacillus sp. (in: firmicutes)]